ncbi:hypothetical protein MVEN_02571100 [Mycena venus]|uniref:G domain-containing protein n=1 Tax=Mycena venus TaxID=2733690 RepID=A0A8H6WRE8_9AGAR|nr:hypothetical protein MVEN_02571100 [Mycena venus]
MGEVVPLPINIRSQADRLSLSNAQIREDPITLVSNSPAETLEDPIALLSQIPAKSFPLRVLVIGKSGSGKSSLISRIFGVSLKNISHLTAGEANIDHEFKPEENTHFILHDSVGTEPGSIQAVEKVKAFLRSRCGAEAAGKPIEYQVHIIWLCVSIPASESRLLETGDIEFWDLAKVMNVPLLVVFTQFDNLVACILRKELKTDRNSSRESCRPAALEKFKSLLDGRLASINEEREQNGKSPILINDYALTSGLGFNSETTKPHLLDDYAVSNLRALVKKTWVLGEQNLQYAEAWPTYATAQRASAKEKILSSLQQSISKYQKGLDGAAPTLAVQPAARTLHQDIIASWNIYDPTKLLDYHSFSNVVANLVPSEPAKTDTELFMAYIVDLNLVLERVLFKMLCAAPGKPLTRTDIDEEYYAYSAAKIHQELWEQVTSVDAAKLEDFILKHLSTVEGT